MSSYYYPRPAVFTGIISKKEVPVDDVFLRERKLSWVQSFSSDGDLPGPLSEDKYGDSCDPYPRAGEPQRILINSTRHQRTFAHTGLFLRPRAR